MRRYTVEIGPQAKADMDEIAAYIARESPLNAERFIAKLDRAIQSLTVYPRRHRAAPESVIKGLVVRQLVVGNYRILYVARKSEVSIVGVRHAMRHF